MLPHDSDVQTFKDGFENVPDWLKPQDGEGYFDMQVRSGLRSVLVQNAPEFDPALTAARWSAETLRGENPNGLLPSTYDVLALDDEVTRLTIELAKSRAALDAVNGALDEADTDELLPFEEDDYNSGRAHAVHEVRTAIGEAVPPAPLDRERVRAALRTWESRQTSSYVLRNNVEEQLIDAFLSLLR